jgi:transcriptional regulator with XRE-family HTH domain
MRNRVKYWRTIRGLTIRELSELSGVSTQTIVNAEKPEAPLPTPAVRKKLAKALKIGVEDLIEPQSLDDLLKENEGQTSAKKIEPVAA